MDSNKITPTTRGGCLDSEGRPPSAARRREVFSGFRQARRWRTVAEVVAAYDRAHGRTRRRVRPVAVPTTVRPRARQSRPRAVRAARTSASSASDSSGSSGDSDGSSPAGRCPARSIPAAPVGAAS